MLNRWADGPESNHLQLFLFTVSQRRRRRWRHSRHFDSGYLSNQTSSEWLTTIITSQTFPWLIKLVAIRSNILSTNTDEQINFWYAVRVHPLLVTFNMFSLFFLSKFWWSLVDVPRSRTDNYPDSIHGNTALTGLALAVTSSIMPTCQCGPHSDCGLISSTQGIIKWTIYVW